MKIKLTSLRRSCGCENEAPGVGLQMAESEKDKAVRRTSPVPGNKETTAIERQGLAAAFLRDKTIRSTIANDLLPITLAHSARYGEQSSLLPTSGGVRYQFRNF